MLMSHSLMDTQQCTVRSKVFLGLFFINEARKWCYFFLRLNIKSKRQNEEEQAQTQIQHYFVFTYFDFQLTTVKQVH